MKFVLHNRYPIESLPEDIRPDLPEGTHVRLVIEPAMSDEEVLAEFDREIEKGLAQLEGGLGIPIDEAERRLMSRFRRPADAAE